MAEMMKAVRFHEYGDAGVLTYEDTPRPDPGSGEVLVKVKATSVNPIDWKLREGYLRQMMPIAFPFVPGGDLAGVVTSVGKGVTGFMPGDAVFGVAPSQAGGGYAEYAVTPAATLTHKPESVSFVEAASVPIVAMTAWQALFDIGGLSAGQSVLIHGGAGGVGLFAVQFAKWKGANPIYATAAADDKAFVTGLGATWVIDYKNERFEEVVQEVDVVLDLIGGETQERSWGILKPGGILVSSTAPPPAEKATAHHVRAAMVQLKPTQENLREIADLLTHGAIRTEIGKTFPLAAAKAAQGLSQHGHVRGKIVLTID